MGVGVLHSPFPTREEISCKVLLQCLAQLAKILHMAQTPTPLRMAVFQSGRTQRQIAADAGMDETHLSKIVRGRHSPDHATRQRIAAALKLSEEALWPELGDDAVAA
ncbi:MAG: hypothetical protein JWM31_30 [Solirubrobacterales bacterium]|nr:hypothetical protein [Solirubrobacterales bacterium]